MIWITGDTHGGLDMQKLSSDELKAAGIHFTEGDTLIITGDFGFPFTPDNIAEYEASGGRSGEYAFWINWFREQPYRVLFVDGNHDNHDWWSRQPVTELYGGRVQVHPHAENIVHLMRGEVYEIGGKSFFTFGGAASIDKVYRTEGYTWWSAEEASPEETAHALESLERVGNRVDFVLTHTLPESVIREIPRFSHKRYPCTTARFLDTVLERVQYDKWFCGHFHIDLEIPARRMFVLYNTVNELGAFDAVLRGERMLWSSYG